MGCISKQLEDRLRNSRSYFRQLTEQASEVTGSIRIPKDVKDIKECVDMGFDPVHAAYVSVQNLVSSFALMLLVEQRAARMPRVFGYPSSMAGLTKPVRGRFRIVAS